MFGESIPIARINYFAVFTFCVQLLDKLAKALNGDSEGKPCGRGFHFVDELLEGIVEHRRDDVKLLLLPYWEPLKDAKGIFASVDPNVSISTYLWSTSI